MSNAFIVRVNPQIMGFFKTEMFDYEGFMGIEGCACAQCGVKSHNPFTWITCRMGMIRSSLYHRYGIYYWLSNKWDDFTERFTNKCSFCDRSNIFHPVSHHSYWGIDEDDDRYDKKWCQFCWNERVGEGGCGYVHDL